ncbi:MAG: hypothetical protein U0939_08890 [Pirellulales bacterium]
MDRILLCLVGGAYLLLAAWCTAMPETTARSVGFELTKGAGQSEYLTVYGGLEFGLGLLLLEPVVRRRPTVSALQTCAVIHVCLVAFRTLGFLLYRDIAFTTYFLAGVEWLIAGASVSVLVRSRSSTSGAAA